MKSSIRKLSGSWVFLALFIGTAQASTETDLFQCIDGISSAVTNPLLYKNNYDYSTDTSIPFYSSFLRGGPNGETPVFAALPKSDCLRSDETFCTESDNSLKLVTLDGVYALEITPEIMKRAGRSGALLLKITGIAPRPLLVEYRKSELKPGSGFASQWFTENALFIMNFDFTKIRGRPESEYFAVGAKPLNTQASEEVLQRLSMLSHKVMSSAPERIYHRVKANHVFEGYAKQRLANAQDSLKQQQDAVAQLNAESARVDKILAELSQSGSSSLNNEVKTWIVQDYQTRKAKIEKDLPLQNEEMLARTKYVGAAQVELDRLLATTKAYLAEREPLRDAALAALAACSTLPGSKEVADSAREQLQAAQ